LSSQAERPGPDTATGITNYASRITPYASRITHQASRITHHASRLTHASRMASGPQSMTNGNAHFPAQAGIVPPRAAQAARTTAPSSLPRAARAAALAAACLIGAAPLAGCSSTARQVPIPYAIVLTADPQVNPDANSRPSPIQVTVYELKSPGTFQSRDYFSLQGDPQAALGKDLLNTDQVILQPGQTETLERQGNGEARVVGIVAGYRDLENSRWRLVIPLPEAQNTNIYKVWQFSPNEEKIQIAVGTKGLSETDRNRSWWPF
jgi:type VI secretion system protein VasD